MVEQQAVYVIGVVILICSLILLSKKLKVAYPILLVLGGLSVSFLPFVPRIHLNPDAVFIIFLPPLLFEAASAASWKEIWRWRRTISLYTFVVVFLTAGAVAFVANWLIPGFSLVLGFLLGGIVSPPDAVSATAIMKSVRVPRRIQTIIEGESLFNDASSIIIARFSLLALGAGQLLWQNAVESFLWMVLGGVAIGLAVMWCLLHLHTLLPTDAHLDVVFTLLAPYILYLMGESLHVSGVLAVVCGGLYIGQHNVKYMDSTSRLHGLTVWDNLTFLLNGFVFMLIGLDLPEIVSAMRASNFSITLFTVYGVLITALLIIVRMSVSFISIYATRLIARFAPVADSRHPGFGPVFIIGWAGMRGVVSLASALSLPIEINGEPFVFRGPIIYITFLVILLTLVLQGTTLPAVIRHTRFPDYHDHLPEKEASEIIRRGLAACSLEYIKELEQKSSASSVDDDFIRMMIEHWNEQLKSETLTPLLGDENGTYRKILHRQLQYLYNLNKTNMNMDEELIKKYIHRIDIEEERLEND